MVCINCPPGYSFIDGRCLSCPPGSVLVNGLCSTINIDPLDPLLPPIFDPPIIDPVDPPTDPCYVYDPINDIYVRDIYCDYGEEDDPRDPEGVCPPGFYFVNGRCVKYPNAPPELPPEGGTCPYGYELVDNVCVRKIFWVIPPISLDPPVIQFPTTPGTPSEPPLTACPCGTRLFDIPLISGTGNSRVWQGSIFIPTGARYSGITSPSPCSSAPGPWVLSVRVAFASGRFRVTVTRNDGQPSGIGGTDSEAGFNNVTGQLSLRVNSQLAYSNPQSNLIFGTWTINIYYITLPGINSLRVIGNSLVPNLTFNGFNQILTIPGFANETFSIESTSLPITQQFKAYFLNLFPMTRPHQIYIFSLLSSLGNRIQLPTTYGTIAARIEGAIFTPKGRGNLYGPC